ncbi:hypothetical protein [Georgenia deserti]|uniref:Ribosomally synthesized peptide with SipW-like signal peptide n=1 Tax=Georgenia deserti TaxID=2093781 RepID=A0ABW4L1N6_9MICO
MRRGGYPDATQRDAPTTRVRRRRRRSVVVRLMVACSLLLAPALVGTMAAWQDSGTAELGGFETGTLDLQIDNDLAGTGGTTTRTWSATGLIPGQYRSFGAEIRNTGDVAFTYGLTVAAGSVWGYGNGVLEVSAFRGTPQSDGTCTGWSIGTARTIPAAGPVFTSRPLPTAEGATSEPICVRVRIMPSAPSGTQGASGTLRLTFTATQVAP